VTYSTEGSSTKESSDEVVRLVGVVIAVLSIEHANHVHDHHWDTE